jgi:putative heme-binding domain-containing protein
MHRVFLAAAMFVLSALGAVSSAQQFLQDHPGQYTQAEIDAGARVYSSQCAVCHGPNGDQVSGIDLRRQQFRRSSSDEDLARVISTGAAGGAMPAFKLQPAELVGVIAFIRAGFDPTARPVRVGAAAQGKTIVEGKGACLSCHRINGIGSRVAPDLSDVGVARQVDALHRSLTNPSSGMMPINRPVKITMKDGRTISGRRLNEDTFTVQLIDDKERLHSLLKSDMRSFVVETTSTMPVFAGKLSEAEIADVIAYLLTLRGQ